jgi:hypothetical protein
MLGSVGKTKSHSSRPLGQWARKGNWASSSFVGCPVLHMSELNDALIIKECALESQNNLSFDNSAQLGRKSALW